MYGTVAKFKVKAGHEAALVELSERMSDEIASDGMVAETVYQLDSDPSTLIIAVVFRDEESYRANAASPAQHERYLSYMEHLESEPEWMDGKVLYSQQY